MVVRVHPQGPVYAGSNSGQFQWSHKPQPKGFMGSNPIPATSFRSGKCYGSTSSSNLESVGSTPTPLATLEEAMSDYAERKKARTKLYFSQHGKKLTVCGACSGSGYYDANGAPRCGYCGGTGKVRED